MRILFFEANTSVQSLTIYPIAIGIVLAILFPWAAVLGAWIGRAPKALLHSIQFSEATKRRILEYEESAKEEDAKAQLEAAIESRKIEAARRLEEARGVSEEAEEELEKSRAETVRSEAGGDDSLDGFTREILNTITKIDSGQFFVDTFGIYAGNPSRGALRLLGVGETHREALLLAHAVEELQNRKLIRHLDNYPEGVKEFELTLQGYDAV